MNQLLSVLQSLSLTEPRALWLLVVAVPLMLFAARARLGATPAALRGGVLGVRLAIVGLLVVALAGATLRPPGRGRAVVFAIDVSDSITPDQQLWARTWVDRAAHALPPGSRSATIEFGASAQLDGSQPPPTSTTDLNAALRLAGTLVPRDPTLVPEIVLLTDGWQTAAGSPADALPSGVAVSYVALPPPPTDQRPPAVVHALDAPSLGRTGDQIDVSIDLQAAQAVDGRLRVLLDQTVVTDGPVHLEAGDTRLVVPAHLGAAGFAVIRAELQVGDLKNALTSVVVVKPAGRVLVLANDPTGADGLVALLTQSGLQVERQRVSSLPPSASA
jgi:hypothetical protein